MSIFNNSTSLESLICLVNLLEKEKIDLNSQNSVENLEIITQLKVTYPEYFSANNFSKKENLNFLLSWLKLKEQSSLYKLGILRKTIFYTTILTGLLVGLSSSVLIFNYNGKEAINLALPLISFVLLPILILFFNVLFLAPTNFIKKLPIFNKLYSVFGYFSPGRILSKFLSKFSIKNSFLPGQSSSILGLKSSSKIWKWFFLNLNQIFAASFFVAVLIYFIFQISIKDVAFAWGSTLEISSSHVFHLTESISWPWKNFIPEARPSAELIEETRIYRLGEIAKTQSEAARFGSWWYFLAASIFTYGLFPRLLLLCFIGPYKNKLIKDSHLKIPGLSQVLSRLKAPRVKINASQGAERSFSNNSNINPSSASSNFPNYKMQGNSFLISWNFSLTKEQIKILGGDKIKDENYFNLSFTTEIDAFEEKLNQTKKTLKNNPSALMVFRAWEIPLLETLLQLKDLASNFSISSPLQIILVDPISSEELKPATQCQNEVWSNKLNSIEANIIICTSSDLRENIPTTKDND